MLAEEGHHSASTGDDGSDGTAERESSASLALHDVTQVFRRPTGAPHIAIKSVSLSIKSGEFVSIVGPTGCGKSTILSAICGLRPPTAGEVRIGGKRVTGVRRDVGFVFQRDALLPWKTALQNVELPLRFRGVNRAEARDRARFWLDRVGLAASADTFPGQLSGGMRKRVSIASTLVYEPAVLLMDEPFSALDVQTRTIMENDLLEIWSATANQTVVFVTHDLEEAIALADRVVVLTSTPGRVLGDYTVEIPRPRDLLEIKLEPKLTALYKTIWSDLETEVLKANRMSRSTRRNDQ